LMLDAFLVLVAVGAVALVVVAAFWRAPHG
jgi:hypothetical protein